MKPLLLAVLAISVSTPAFGQWLRADIQQARGKLEAAFASGDFQKVDTLYAADALMMPPHGAAVRGPLAIERYWARARRSGLAGISFQPQDIASAGDVARETGRFTASFAGPDRAPIRVAGHYMALWKDTWGGWKLEAEIWNAGYWP